MSNFLHSDIFTKKEFLSYNQGTLIEFTREDSIPLEICDVNNLRDVYSYHVTNFQLYLPKVGETALIIKVICSKEEHKMNYLVVLMNNLYLLVSEVELYYSFKKISTEITK